MNLLKRDLDHHTWKILKLHELQDKKILVALSGGVDSVALMRTLAKTHEKSLMEAFYFHHGDGENGAYRDQAAVFCTELCAALKIPLHISKANTELSSEAGYRELRYAEIERLKNMHGFQVVALGHHQDDLLETRLLRLVRGTGGQGLTAMKEWDGKLLRPFLSKSKAELEKYLQEEAQNFCEDPTNRHLDPLRNWMRQEWLPQLEARAVGSVSSLARSLETLAAEAQTREDLLAPEENYKTHGFRRSYYLTLTASEQKRLLAQYLFSLGKKDFSQAHLEEIQKRLDKSQKVITFQVGGCHWEINAEQIKVQS